MAPAEVPVLEALKRKRYDNLKIINTKRCCILNAILGEAVKIIQQRPKIIQSLKFLHAKILTFILVGSEWLTYTGDWSLQISVNTEKSRKNPEWKFPKIPKSWGSGSGYENLKKKSVEPRVRNPGNLKILGIEIWKFLRQGVFFKNL